MPKTAREIALSVLCAALGATLVACGPSSTRTPQPSTSGETPSAPAPSLTRGDRGSAGANVLKITDSQRASGSATFTMC